jgi:hypothetical protein
MNLYIEPGLKEHIVKRAEKAVVTVKDMIRQFADAKIIVAGDLNGHVTLIHESLTKLGFFPALEPGTPTHRDGNHLDQLWVRNLEITAVALADRNDSVSDHHQIMVRIGQYFRMSRIEDPLSGEAIKENLHTLTQATIKKILHDPECQEALADADITQRRYLDMAPVEIV